MKCNFCEKESPEGSIYCTSCGMKLSLEKAVSIEEKMWENESEQQQYSSKAHIFGFIAIGLALGATIIPFMGQIAALVFGIIAFVKGLCHRNKSNLKRCNVGLILGIISIVLALAMFVHWVFILDSDVIYNTTKTGEFVLKVFKLI